MVEKKETDLSKIKALDLALANIEKQFGKGSILKYGEGFNLEGIKTCPTGLLELDIKLGGGIPQGRIIEIFGPESSGKTTLTLHIAAECQQQGGTVAFIDAEHALDTAYAAKLGVDVKNLLVSQPDNGEQALEICDMLARSGAVNLIIVDSVAALTPKAELEGEMGDSHMGLQARLMSQACRKLTSTLSKSNCTIIFINQLRMKIGVMFGNPETTTGGNALKFYASQRIDVRRNIGDNTKNEDGELLSNKTQIKIIKNKIFPPFKTVEVDIVYGEGFCKVGNILDMGVKYGIVDKAGAWYSYQNSKIGQGRDNSKRFLKDNPEILQDITAKVLKVAETGEIPE